MNVLQIVLRFGDLDFNDTIVQLENVVANTDSALWRSPLFQTTRGGAVKDFRQLKVWDKAHQLTLEIYRATTTFPREEAYGLTSQIRRASASIGANLAEGCGRSGDIELARFCSIARGS